MEVCQPGKKEIHVAEAQNTVSARIAKHDTYDLDIHCCNTISLLHANPAVGFRVLLSSGCYSKVIGMACEIKLIYHSEGEGLVSTYRGRGRLGSMS